MRFDDDCHEKRCFRDDFDCRRDEFRFDDDFGCGCKRNRRCGFFNIFRGCGRRHHHHNHHCDCRRRCCDRDFF